MDGLIGAGPFVGAPRPPWSPSGGSLSLREIRQFDCGPTWLLADVIF